MARLGDLHSAVINRSPVCFGHRKHMPAKGSAKKEKGQKQTGGQREKLPGRKPFGKSAKAGIEKEKEGKKGPGSTKKEKGISPLAQDHIQKHKQK